MVVDDSEVDRKIIGKIISRNIQGVEVLECDDGYNVVDLIKTNKVMACILDLKMPNVDGLEILRKLKSDVETEDIPIIVCTGVADLATMEQVLKLGAYDFFTKPFGKEEMKLSLPLKIRNAVELSKRTHYIMRLSQIDHLTELYNRSFFMAFMDGRVNRIVDSENTTYSVLMCDINGLKVVNDAFGSSAGDYFLKGVSDILKTTLGNECICARWGGDEFTCYIPKISNLEVQRLVKKIKTQVKKLNYKSLSVSLAIGVETVSGQNESIVKALSVAEDSMFRDKILENESAHNSMIATILNTLNVKNPREEAHSRRVSELCEKMGVAMSLSTQDIHDLKIIGLLHDIGKITIDEKILNKPDRLTEEEYSEIKRHPEMGYRILSTSKEMHPYLNIILCHHERVDGNGYPNGLKGAQIPLMARILTVIDSFDAMTCHRPYRAAKSTEAAIEELVNGSGTQFDAEIVEIFIKQVVMQ